MKVQDLVYPESYLCDLCITDVEDRGISRGFSGGHFCKLFDVSVASGQ
jgi:hypothetical protein